MTVKELIEELKKLDQDLPVVFTDYEGGDFLVSDVSEITVQGWQGDTIKVAHLHSKTGAI